MTDPILFDLLLTIAACGALVGALVLTAMLLPLGEEELSIADREFEMWLGATRARAITWGHQVILSVRHRLRHSAGVATR